MSEFRKLMARFTASEEVKKEGLYPYFREICTEQGTEVIHEGKKLLMFGSNSYLGLSIHPEVKEAAQQATSRYGTSCGGSRFLNGTLDLHSLLEHSLADFLGFDSVLVFSTGFQANLGAISALSGRHHYLLLDESNHASIIDGARLSFAKTIKYKHNNPSDLENCLKDLPLNAVKFIVTDGLFSMEGDIAKLPEIAPFREKYNAVLMVDDAHALGVLGKEGKGTASHFGVENQVDILVGTFSKSLASLGGFVASDKQTIEYLKHHSRPMIFSASMTPASCAAALKSLEIIKKEPERIQKLWENTNFARKLLIEAGFDIGHSQSPILPVYIRDNQKTFIISKILQDDGVFVNPVVSPAVKSDDSLIRFSFMSSHTFLMIEEAIQKLIKAATSVGIPLKSSSKIKNPVF